MTRKHIHEINCPVENCNPAGHGIAHVDGKSYLLPYAVPGDEVRFNTGNPKGYKIIKPSSLRAAEIPCKYYFECGGCGLQHFTTEGQLGFKKIITENLLKEQELNVRVFPVAGMENPWRYRNKMAFSFFEKQGKILCGLYQEESHRLVDIDDCLLHHEMAAAIVSVFKSYLSELRVPIYNQKTGEGLLRHLVIRHSSSTGEFMVIIVIGSRGLRLPQQDYLIQLLRKICPAISSVYLNVNDKPGNMILGNAFILLWGSKFLNDEISGLKFDISPGSFFQVNPQQTTILYEKIMKACNLKGDELVYDLYSGVGTISLFVARYAGRVIGIESSAESVKAARHNSALNGITNVTFFAAQVEKAVFFHFKNTGKPQVVILDPPRTGCGYPVLKAMLDACPKKIIYVSCNPETLATDLKTLSRKYFIRFVEPVDMFPQTLHIENVVLLELKQK